MNKNEYSNLPEAEAEEYLQEYIETKGICSPEEGINIEPEPVATEETNAQIMPMSTISRAAKPVVDGSTSPEQLFESIPSGMKNYQDAPFRYSFKDHETVNKVSGALEYTYTNFVLPGKNGFDLAVTRCYDSSVSNVQSLDVNIVNTPVY